jgi:hypothetical protein
VPEKDDVMLPEKPGSPLASAGSADVAGAREGLRCLSSGYLGDDGRCECSIPEHVVAAAWQRQREQHAASEGFFRLMWSEGMWLAFGHSDGGVRGVYCPEHAADRDQRASAALAGARVPQLVA